MSVFCDILPDTDIMLDNRYVKNYHEWWNIRAELYIKTYIYIVNIKHKNALIASK